MKEIAVKLLADPVVWSVILALVMFAAGWIVKKTKTTKDDEAYNTVLKFINAAFVVAEKAIPDTAGGKLSKADTALKDFLARYEARFGAQAPEDVKAWAKAEWAIMAQEIKQAKA